MQEKIKIMTVVGTRPEIIRLSRVIHCLDKNASHLLVHTGQNYDYELNEIFFRDLDLRKPDYFLEAAGATAIETIGQIMRKMEPVLAKEKPDALLILGDTNSCLAAYVAKRKKIPIFHMEAGNRCFDERVPEEVNRRIVDHISDINLPYSDIARSYLIREGITPDRIIKTGSPLYEVLTYYSEKIEKSKILQELQLKPREFFVVSSHREENIDLEENFSRLAQIFNLIAEKFGKKIIVSTHPRIRKRIEDTKIKFSKDILFLKPLGFLDYIQLQRNALAVLSDSGTITEESSILNFPALNIRETHERPEGMEEASVMMTGLNPERVLQALHTVMKQSFGESRRFSLVKDYNAPNISEKVFRIILSYTDYINRVVWQKH